MTRMTDAQLESALAVEEENLVFAALLEVLARYEDVTDATAGDEAEDRELRLGALVRKDACRQIQSTLRQWRERAVAAGKG